MSLTRLAAVIQKEMLHIMRDKRSLVATILIPLMLMFAFCESLSLDVNNIPTVIIDYDRSPESRDFIGRFTSSGYFSIVEYVDNYRQMQRAIDRGDAVMGLSIPRDFGRKVRRADTGIPMQILLDGTDPNRGSIAAGYSALITQNFSREIIKNRFQQLGMSPSGSSIESQIRIWYNPSLRSKNYLVPGLMAMIMAILAALLTSTTVSREWENGTMELLISTPVSVFEIIIGKFIPYFIIGAIDSVLILLLGYYVYGVPIKGSLILLALVTTLFLSGMLMLGLFVSCAFRSSLMSNQIAFTVTYIPTMLLSGFIFFIPGMPWILQMVTQLVPARYFLTCTRSIFAKGVGLEVLGFDVFLLFAFNLLMFLLAFISFKKTLDVK
ncbi:MAG: ABC transporter permease [Candidatus Xenobiia bacterium LiM19]